MEESPRLALARLAERAALEDPAVHSLDSGPSGLKATRSRDGLVGGVVCSAVAGGGFSIDLHVVALPEDLHAMSDRVRATVRESAAASGVEDQVRSVSVHVEDIAETAAGGPA